MGIKQISVFLENRLGRLKEVVSLLGRNNINIRALSLADKADYGILRLIVNDKNKALRVLKENNFTVDETEVIAFEVEDKPGGLSKILDYLVDAKISVEYIYAFVEKSNQKAVVVIRVEDIKKAEKILRKNKVRLLKEKEIKKL